MSFFSAFRIVFPGRIYGGPQTPLKSPSQISQHQGRAPIYHLFHGKNEETDIPMVAASDPSGELISWFLCWISWFLSHDRSFFLLVCWFMPMFNGFCCFYFSAVLMIWWWNHHFSPMKSPILSRWSPHFSGFSREKKRCELGASRLGAHSAGAVSDCHDGRRWWRAGETYRRRLQGGAPAINQDLTSKNRDLSKKEGDL